MITVMGATGQTGSQIARLLLYAGEEVRALGRSERRLADLGHAGAETLAGDAADVDYLTEAFRGSDAVYTLLPLDPASPDHHAHQARLGETIVRAVRDAGVRHVVALSSVGADVASGTGFVTALHAQEQRLRTLSGTAVLVLRPGNFFENFAASIPLIEEAGVNGDAVEPDVPLPMVATRDIAEAAAAALRARDWEGVVVRELLGPRDLTYAEVTRILGAALGRPGLRYVRFPDPDVVAGLLQAGFSEHAAGLHLEMARAFSDGTVRSRAGRSAATATPTRFEDVAPELVRVHQPA